jgi:hypothetical protein
MVSDLAIKTPEVSNLEKSFMEAFLTFLLGPQDVEDAARALWLLCNRSTRI